MLKQILVTVCLSTLAFAGGYHEVPVLRSTHSSLANNEVVKRASDGYVADGLNYSSYLYFAVFNLGSDEQQQIALIDTGSSDLWVYRKNKDVPKGFDTSSSSSARDLHESFDSTYVSGSNIKGEYYKDTLKWGDAEVDLQFAVVNGTSGSHGIFGIAYESVENKGPYPNYPYALKDQGYIESVAYSLCLNSDEGSIVFGAVDSSRYTGPLKEMPVAENGSVRLNFQVGGHNAAGALDSGTTNTYIPDEILADVAKSLNATYNSDVQLYEANDSVDGTSLSFTFDGVNVTMYQDILWEHKSGQGDKWFLNIYASSRLSNATILGASFLNSAYVVYDLERERMAVAQVNTNPGSPNYQIINGSIPGAV